MNLGKTDRTDRAIDRANSNARAAEAEKFFEELLQEAGDPTNYQTNNEAIISCISATIPKKYQKKTVADVLAYLSFYADNKPFNDLKGGKLLTPDRKSGLEGAMNPPKDSPYALKITMMIGNEPFEFVLMPARDRQMYMEFMAEGIDYNYYGS